MIKVFLFINHGFEILFLQCGFLGEIGEAGFGHTQHALGQSWGNIIIL